MHEKTQIIFIDFFFNIAQHSENISNGSNDSGRDYWQEAVYKRKLQLQGLYPIVVLKDGKLVRVYVNQKSEPPKNDLKHYSPEKHEKNPIPSLRHGKNIEQIELNHQPTSTTAIHEIIRGETMQQQPMGSFRSGTRTDNNKKLMSATTQMPIGTPQPLPYLRKTTSRRVITTTPRNIATTIEIHSLQPIEVLESPIKIAKAIELNAKTVENNEFYKSKKIEIQPTTESIGQFQMNYRNIPSATDPRKTKGHIPNMSPSEMPSTMELPEFKTTAQTSEMLSKFSLEETTTANRVVTSTDDKNYKTTSKPFATDYAKGTTEPIESIMTDLSASEILSATMVFALNESMTQTNEILSTESLFKTTDTLDELFQQAANSLKIEATTTNRIATFSESGGDEIGTMPIMTTRFEEEITEPMDTTLVNKNPSEIPLTTKLPDYKPTTETSEILSTTFGKAADASEIETTTENWIIQSTEYEKSQTVAPSIDSTSYKEGITVSVETTTYDKSSSKMQSTITSTKPPKLTTQTNEMESKETTGTLKNLVEKNSTTLKSQKYMKNWITPSTENEKYETSTISMPSITISSTVEKITGPMRKVEIPIQTTVKPNTDSNSMDYVADAGVENMASKSHGTLNEMSYFSDNEAIDKYQDEYKMDQLMPILKSNKKSKRFTSGA